MCMDQKVIIERCIMDLVCCLSAVKRVFFFYDSFMISVYGENAFGQGEFLDEVLWEPQGKG